MYRSIFGLYSSYERVPLRAAMIRKVEGIERGSALGYIPDSAVFALTINPAGTIIEEHPTLYSVRI